MSDRYQLSNTREILGVQSVRKGYLLGIPCKYMYSFGKPQHSDGDLPDGWTSEWIPPSSGRGQAAGFKVSPIYVGENEAGETVGSHDPKEGFKETGYAYLLTPEGQIVATWDEGRWWTPRESDQFQAELMASYREERTGALTDALHDMGVINVFGLGTAVQRPDFVWREGDVE